MQALLDRLSLESQGFRRQRREEVFGSVVYLYQFILSVDQQVASSTLLFLCCFPS
jgi:hypothetical protein